MSLYMYVYIDVYMYRCTHIHINTVIIIINIMTSIIQAQWEPETAKMLCQWLLSGGEDAVSSQLYHYYT